MSALPQQRSEYVTPGVLSRTLDLTRLNIEVLAFVAIVVLSIIAHLYGLGRMALHHDESIHAWMSWKFFTGSGGFTCFGGRTANTYCYEPTYHGPSLYIFTLVSYFLFGDGDWQARLPQAVAGIGMVASVWMLRPYLGTRGTLVAALLLGFAPSLLYYTRFARHDGLILLWTLWMVIGFFRYLDSGRAGYLVLMAAGISLAIATHELYYLLFFIFGWFVIIRLAYERLPLRLLNIILLAVVGLAFILELWNPRITPTLRAAGMANLLISVALGGFLMVRVWDRQPILTNRIAWLWREQRGALWAALSVLAAIYIVMYSTFFADPQSLINGLYAGLAYWLGSQQEAARGDQPWYYHLMLLAIYEPLTLFGGIGAMIYLYTRDLQGVLARRLVAPARASAPARVTSTDETVEDEAQEGAERAQEGAGAVEEDASDAEAAEDAPQPTTPQWVVPIFPLFLAFWFTGALVSFSWAGEKMPWLVTHISLPGNLLIAWALGKLIEQVDWRNLARERLMLVPPFLVLTIVALGVAYWRFSTPASDQQGQAALLQGLVPLAVGGGMLYALLTIGQRAGWRTTAALGGLTISAVLGFGMVRATWMVVYNHPDTPIEPLVYVQSSPDVPLIVRNIRELAVNQTRNIRTESDPVGGLTMPVIMDAGDPAAGGEGSLAWPYQWYLRDFKRLESRNSEFFRTATADSFIVEPVQLGADRELAPVVLVSKGSVNEVARGALEENYVKRFDSKLNWWFPEGFKCDPKTTGYKRFYYSTWMTADALKDCPSIDPTQLAPIYAPLIWPLDGSHWGDTWKYLVYRELPADLRLDGREMEVWVRRDLAPVGGQEGAGSVGGPLKLVAQQAIGGPSELSGPSGVAVDAQGNLYVADTNNHRIQVYGPDGAPVRTIGSFGSGAGQFNEPRGVAVDAQGMIYVADTWNARVVKLDPQGNQIATWGSGTEDFGNGRVASPTDGTLAGNAAAPLSLFGPRGIAVDAQGNVYIADTGNKRIVVTDSQGNYLLQWGEFGSAPGQFSEPTALAIDGANIYVADTWNGRVQMFTRDESGQVSGAPTATWRVPGWQAQTYDDPAIAARAGQVAVSIPGRNMIMLTDATGQELLRWGGAGTDLASMRLPSGLTFSGDQALTIVDRGNARLLAFRLP